MTSSAYINGRKKYARPQGMLWSENPGTFSNGIYIPSGFEVGAATEETDPNLLDQFIILSDDNRDAIDFEIERIERRERTINGRMRSYHIADKLNISTSWTNLPSRSFSVSPQFNAAGSPTNLETNVDHDDDPSTPNKDVTYSGSPYYKDQQYTTDGGAGGVELLDWYENHQGPFWVYLAYDKYKNFGTEDEDYNRLGVYNQVIQMYFSDFSYSVQKRGNSNFDFWNISVRLEEV